MLNVRAKAILAVLVAIPIALLAIGGVGYRSEVAFELADSMDDHKDLRVWLQNNGDAWNVAGLVGYWEYGSPFDLHLSQTFAEDTSITAVNIETLLVEADDVEMARVEDNEIDLAAVRQRYPAETGDTWVPKKDLWYSLGQPIDTTAREVVVKGKLFLIEGDQKTEIVFERRFERKDESRFEVGL